MREFELSGSVNDLQEAFDVTQGVYSRPSVLIQLPDDELNYTSKIQEWPHARVVEGLVELWTWSIKIAWSRPTSSTSYRTNCLNSPRSVVCPSSGMIRTINLACCCKTEERKEVID